MAFKSAAELFGDNAGWGPQVPIAFTAPSGGYAATNRGIGFGEQLTSAIGNRSHWALALNDDDLNTRLALWETGGLDAAYDLGGAAVPGGGRDIVKDSGAVETVSMLSSAYGDDSTNAHFRANALADSIAGGGGFDFRGRENSGYGLLSRTNQAVSGAYTSLSGLANGTLNPGGVGTDTIRYSAGTVSDGTNTDLSLNSMDFIEVSGASLGVNGLYIIHSLGPTPATDIRVRCLDGTAPTFSTGVAVTLRLFRAHMMSSVSGRSLPSSLGPISLAVSAGKSYGAGLALFGNDLEGVFSTGAPTIRFVHRGRTGANVSAASFSSTGRYLSSLNTSHFDAAGAQDFERANAGVSAVDIDKGSSTAGHEIGVLVREQSGTSKSWVGLETRRGFTAPDVATFYGVDTSINGTFASPMGRILLPDSDGSPTPPTGQLKTQWAGLVQPGLTLVRTLTGTGSGRYYLLKSVELTAALSPDEITICRLDGSALTALELPTSGSMTFQFVQRSVIAGRLPAITVDDGPSSLTLPADVTPSTYLVTPYDMPTGDVLGAVSLAVNGAVAGLRSYDVDDATLPRTANTDILWWIGNEGNFHTRGELNADGDISGGLLRSRGTHRVTCLQTDVVINHSLHNATSEQTAAGLSCWRFDSATNTWELIDLGGGNAALYFPLMFSGRLMTTTVQMFLAAGSSHPVDASLFSLTPTWGSPGTAATALASDTAALTNLAVWTELVISHGSGAGTALDLSTANYSIRVRGNRVGDKVRAIRHSVRYTSLGPGGIGG